MQERRLERRRGSRKAKSSVNRRNRTREEEEDVFFPFPLKIPGSSSDSRLLLSISCLRVVRVSCRRHRQQSLRSAQVGDWKGDQSGWQGLRRIGTKGKWNLQTREERMKTRHK